MKPTLSDRTLQQTSDQIEYIVPDRSEIDHPNANPNENINDETSDKSSETKENVVGEKYGEIFHPYENTAEELSDENVNQNESRSVMSRICPHRKTNCSKSEPDGENSSNEQDESENPDLNDNIPQRNAQDIACQVDNILDIAGTSINTVDLLEDCCNDAQFEVFLKLQKQEFEKLFSKKEEKCLNSNKSAKGKQSKNDEHSKEVKAL